MSVREYGILLRYSLHCSFNVPCISRGDLLKRPPSHVLNSKPAGPARAGPACIRHCGTSPRRTSLHKTLRDQPAQDQPANGTSRFAISGALYFQILIWENLKEVFYRRGIVFIHKDENKVESYKMVMLFCC